MEKINSYGPERSRQVILIIIFGIGLILGIIVLMLCIQSLFIDNSASNIYFTALCSEWEPINFFKKIQASKAIILASVCISTLAFLFLLTITLYSALNTGTWEDNKSRVNVIYAISISIGMLTAIVCFLKSMKVFTNSQQILSSNLNSNCFSMDSYSNMEGKSPELLAMFILAGIKLLMYVCGIAFLPSKFIIGQRPRRLTVKTGKVFNSFEQTDENFLNKRQEHTTEILMPVSSSREEIGDEKGNTLLVRGAKEEINNEDKEVQTNPLIKTKNFKVQTNPLPIMKSFETQVSHAEVIPLRKKELEKEKSQGSDIGVGTNNDLYKVKNTGLMAVVQTNSVGVESLKQTNSQEYGVGEESILENDRERSERSVIYDDTKTNKLESIQLPLRPSSPTSFKSSNHRILNPIEVNEEGYYFLSKQRKSFDEPEVGGVYVVPPFVENPDTSPNRLRSHLKRSKYNLEIRIDDESIDIVGDRVIVFSNDNVENGNSKQTIEYELSEDNENKRNRRERIEKLRYIFYNSPKRRSKSHSPLHYSQFNLEAKLKEEELEEERSIRYNKSQMEEYKFINSLTPHKNKLQNKGVITEAYFQNEKQSKDKRKCEFLGLGEWCGSSKIEE